MTSRKKEQEIKKMYKSTTDNKICGVCGGIAEFLNIDSTIIRGLWLMAILCFGTGIFLYFALALIMPEYPKKEETK